ncbi:SGNH/GDSL hydrolase family protein [Sandaracinobacteroides hominis]|uniref:SGNH/GDSL hydrolase family protein n=1 Tax=Sandaracinobacteroides hominis TaxID=2780086 RepID=UPI0018F78F88|nr:SGNH/GDSL hydrolase family protein [Sandaracinobacteroides hominis]
MTPATFAQLLQQIADPDGDPELLAETLVFDSGQSGPLSPILRLNPRFHPAVDDPLAFESVSDHLRRLRQRRFFTRIARGWSGARVIAQGDSWFQFPLVRDTIRQLDRDHAVYCLSAADPVHNPAAQAALLSAIPEIRPDAVLISAGGSDLFGSSRLKALADPTSAAPGGFSAYLDHFLLRDLMPRFLELFRRVRAIDAQVPILLHSYAYPIPRGIWLSRPLEDVGISDRQQQGSLIRALIDHFHAQLQACIATSGLEYLHLVDCRAVVGGNWFDELHPNHQGFEQVAQCFRLAIAGLR